MLLLAGHTPSPERLPKIVYFLKFAKWHLNCS